MGFNLLQPEGPGLVKTPGKGFTVLQPEAPIPSFPQSPIQLSNQTPLRTELVGEGVAGQVRPDIGRTGMTPIPVETNPLFVTPLDEPTRFNMFRSVYTKPESVGQGLENFAVGGLRTAMSPVGVALGPALNESVVGPYVANLMKYIMAGVGAHGLYEAEKKQAQDIRQDNVTPGTVTENQLNAVLSALMMAPGIKRGIQGVRGMMPIRPEVLPPEAGPRIPPGRQLNEPFIDVEEVAPRGLPGPRGNFVVDPLGQAVNLDVLSPAEKTELMRGPKEYVPRETYVRPAQAAPTLLPERPDIRSQAAEIARMVAEQLQTRGPIVPGREATQPPVEPSGGEVSFRGPLGAIPSAGQHAGYLIPSTGPGIPAFQQLPPGGQGGSTSGQPVITPPPVAPMSGSITSGPQTSEPKTTPGENLPPLIPGERLVTVQRPDGSTYTASFRDRYWDVPTRGKVASIGKPAGDTWSHTMLAPGEQIIEREGQNAGTIRSNQEVVSEQEKQQGQAALQRQGSGEARGDDIQLNEEAGKQTSGAKLSSVEEVAKPFAEKEKELRGPFALSGPRIAIDPNEIGFKDPSKPVDALQLRNRLKNKLTPTEWGFYEDKLPKEGKISPIEAARIMQESGPEVKVSSYGMEAQAGTREAVVGERDRLAHELETYGPYNMDVQYDNVIMEYGKGDAAKEIVFEKPVDEATQIHVDSLPKDEADKVKRWAELASSLLYDETLPSVSADKPVATGAYESVSAFPTSEPMPEWTKTKGKSNVQRVDVAIPHKEKYQSGEPMVKTAMWQPDQLHENLPNTLGWAMVQYKTVEGKKVAFVGEVQSRWGQQFREKTKQYTDAAIENLVSQNNPGIVKGSKEWNESLALAKQQIRNEHPLLKDYNRLILKAVIDQARKEGATHVVLSDAESAMMSEGHDLQLPTLTTEQTEAIRQISARLRRQEISGEEARRFTDEINEQARTVNRIPRPPQEQGMRLNYDTILPKIMEELTGQKGEKVSLGEHKNAVEFEPIDPLLASRAGDMSNYRSKPRSNLIFKTPSGAPKTDVTGLQFDISKEPGKMSMFEKDRPAARATRMYAGIDPTMAIEAVKGVGKGAAELVRWYSEPILERLARVGGPVAKFVAKEGRQIVSRAKQHYGDLTPTLDPAKAAVGKPNAANKWLRAPIQITPGARTTNLFASNEGTVSIPPQHQATVDLFNKANLDIGHLAKQANPSHVPSNKIQRIWTNFLIDVFKRGRGEAWENYAQGVATANGKPVADVKRSMTKIKAAFDLPSVDMTHLDTIAQDHHRQFPKTVSHIKSKGAWHEAVVSDPFNYLETAAQRTSHAVAFREVYPLVKNPVTGKWESSGLLGATRKVVQSELQTGTQGAEFDNLIKALQGHPLDTYKGGLTSPDQPLGAAYRMAGSMLGVPLKSLMLTLNAVVNLGEVAFGGSSSLLGYRATAKATMQNLSKARRAELEQRGVINKPMYNWALDPNAFGRSGARIVANALRKITGQQALNEMQEAQGAGAADVIGERILGNGEPLSQFEKDRYRNVARAMGMSKADAQAMVNGDPDLVQQWKTGAAPFTSAGNQAMAELSRMGASRTWNSVAWFQRYGQMVTNQLRSIAGNLWDDVRAFKREPTRENFTDVYHNFAMLMRRLGGLIGQGAVTKFAVAAATGLTYGIAQQMTEAKNETKKFAIDSLISGAGGLPMLLKKLGQSKDANTLMANLMGLAPGVAASVEAGEAVAGVGRYRGKTLGDKIGGYLGSKTPIADVVKMGLAVSGLSDTDLEFETALKQFYRWRKEQPGYVPVGTVGGTEESFAFKNQMMKVRKVIEQGGDWKKELEGLKDNAQIRKSLYAGTLLEMNNKPLSDEQLNSLEKRIGPGMVEKLKLRDSMIREVARTLGSNEEALHPTGRAAIDYTTPQKRSEMVKKEINKDVLAELQRVGIGNLSFEPNLARGRQPDELLDMQQMEVMKKKFIQDLENRVRLYIGNPQFTNSPLERQKALLQAHVAAARQVAKGMTRQELRPNE